MDDLQLSFRILSDRFAEDKGKAGVPVGDGINYERKVNDIVYGFDLKIIKGQKLLKDKKQSEQSGYCRSMVSLL